MIHIVNSQRVFIGTNSTINREGIIEAAAKGEGDVCIGNNVQIGPYEEFDLDMPVDMRMCHWTELKDTILQQKHYDGSNCVRCYYNNYNEMLGLLTSDIQHRNFL